MSTLAVLEMSIRLVTEFRFHHLSIGFSHRLRHIDMHNLTVNPYETIRIGLLLSLFACGLASASDVAILVYHRFGAVAKDTTTTRTVLFSQQLAALRVNGYDVISLEDALRRLPGASAGATKAVAITIDDGHRSVYDDLFPLIVRERIPVTLFIYPSCIGRADYALTWPQLRTMLASGLVAVQSHTWWHPNFRAEYRRLSPGAYAQLIRSQLEKPRAILHDKLGVPADILAWPYGIHDPTLEKAAADAGYRAALALGGRVATQADSAMALPRIPVNDSSGVRGLLTAIRASGTP